MISGHTQIFLQFSGGKDSLAVLHMMSAHWDKLTVVWTNTGDAFPETIAQMREVEAMVPYFLEIRSDQIRDTERNGWPVDIIPVRSTPFGKLLERHNEPFLRGYPLCCGTNIWAPMLAAAKDRGITMIISGAKECDKRRGPQKDGDVIEGITYSMPLWNKTDDEVMALLGSLGVKLPAHYALTKTSLDCMHCTAYLDENAGKMRYLADHHPATSLIVQDRLTLISRALEAEMAHLKAARNG